MDSEIIKILTELKAIGLNNEKIMALFFLASQDFLEEVKLDLAEASESDLDHLAERVGEIKPETLLLEELNTSFMNILKDIYGLQAESKYKEFLLGYLKETLADAQKAKELLSTIQDGYPPDAIALLQKAQENPDIDQIRAAVDAASKL